MVVHALGPRVVWCVVCMRVGGAACGNGVGRGWEVAVRGVVVVVGGGGVVLVVGGWVAWWGGWRGVVVGRGGGGGGGGGVDVVAVVCVCGGVVCRGGGVKRTRRVLSYLSMRRSLVGEPPLDNMARLINCHMGAIGKHGDKTKKTKRPTCLYACLCRACVRALLTCACSNKYMCATRLHAALRIMQRVGNVGGLLVAHVCG